MGNSYSTHNYPPEIADVLGSIKTKITAKITSTCNSSSSNTQTIIFGGIKARNCNVIIDGVSQQTGTKVNAMCAQDKNFKDMLKITVMEELAELRKKSKPELASEIQKIVDEEVNVEEVSNCMADVYNSQNMDFGGFDISCPMNGRLDINSIYLCSRN
jgi:predicted house-cleaning noncanonical NTP pyrophosphatase (MazG superfamily)